MITPSSKHVRVDGYLGTWHVVGSKSLGNTSYFLLEHELFGADAPDLIVDQTGALIVGGVWDGFEALQYTVDAKARAAQLANNPSGSIMPEPGH
ncbi:MAG: hypothetical protein LKJ90_09485 [Faecalibacterium sp.]|jgi:hypothetical protein|nr:hypothetical protein [Faecalibacterium sp.]